MPKGQQYVFYDALTSVSMSEFEGFIIIPVGNEDFNNYRYSSYPLNINAYGGNYYIKDEAGQFWQVPSN